MKVTVEQLERWNDLATAGRHETLKRELYETYVKAVVEEANGEHADAEAAFQQEIATPQHCGGRAKSGRCGGKRGLCGCLCSACRAACAAKD